MKKSSKRLIIGLIPLFGLLLTGCNLFNMGGEEESSTPTNTSTNPYNPSGGNTSPTDAEQGDNEISKISLKYGSDFYMQVGDALDFSATFESAQADQKGMKWTSSNPNVVSIETKAVESQIVLHALSEGTTKLTATSTYNTSLTKSVNIFVIDETQFTYLWEIRKSSASTTEVSQFNNTAAGVAKPSGTATLGGVNWNFTFESQPDKVGGGQLLTFGAAAKSFGNITFSTANSKQIRKISVKCSSAARKINDGSEYGSSESHGSSKLTIQIGETKYIDGEYTPKHTTASPTSLVEGADLGAAPLSGDISINFSPTYQNVDSEARGGAIYLRAIIIEYYRGEVQELSLEGLNDSNTQFYAGGKFTNKGVKVMAAFAADEANPVDVTRHASFNLANGTTLSQKEAKTVTVTYSHKYSPSATSTKSKSYDIDVAASITSITCDGDFTKDTYLVYDAIDYSGKKIHINTADTASFKTYDLTDFKEEYFLNIFDISGLKTYATKDMENGFTITIKTINPVVSATLSIPASELVVKEVENIAIIYGDGLTPYELVMDQDQQIDYSNFSAKITYDNSDEETFTFTNLLKQKYTSPADGEKYNRFEITSPKVTTTDLSSGYDIIVKSTLNTVSATMHVNEADITIREINSLTINLEGTELVNNDYMENQAMNYEGLYLTVEYYGGASRNIDWDDLKDEKAYVVENDKVVEKDMFIIDAPQKATTSMMNNGFAVEVTYFNNKHSARFEFEANAITVSPYVAKTYTKVKGIADFAEEAEYLIVSYVPDTSNTQMRVWNGSLDAESVMGKTNYLTYNHGSVIGDSLQIEDATYENCSFVITKDANDIINVILKSTYGTEQPLKLTALGTPGFKYYSNPDSDNAQKQKLTLTTDGDELRLGTNNKYIFYNKASNSDKFNMFAKTTNTVGVEFYKIS